MRKAILLAGAVLLFVLMLSGVALAATPQDIYNDYADNGKLDNQYTDEELQAYLDDAYIHQYGDPTIVAELDKLVTEMLGTDEFPMTGAQIGLIAVIAVILIAAGIFLRRMTRKRST
jgi:hypothetical protein